MGILLKFSCNSTEFKFKVNDGSIYSQSATVTINIESVNDVPVANSAEIEVTEKIETDITLTGSDPDEDDMILINEPVLLLGSASVSIDSFILKIIPDLPHSLCRESIPEIYAIKYVLL